MKLLSLMAITILLLVHMLVYAGPSKFFHQSSVEHILETAHIMKFYEMTANNEGFSKVSYQDVGGVWHIGFGHNLEVMGSSRKVCGVPELKAAPNQFITESQGMCLYHYDYVNAISDAVKLVPHLAVKDFGVIGVVVDMSYNMGITNMSTFKKFIAAVEDGNLIHAIKELYDSTYCRQVPRRCRNNMRILERELLYRGQTLS